MRPSGSLFIAHDGAIPNFALLQRKLSYSTQNHLRGARQVSQMHRHSSVGLWHSKQGHIHISALHRRQEPAVALTKTEMARPSKRQFSVPTSDDTDVPHLNSAVCIFLGLGLNKMVLGASLFAVINAASCFAHEPAASGAGTPKHEVVADEHGCVDGDTDVFCGMDVCFLRVVSFHFFQYPSL